MADDGKRMVDLRSEGRRHKVLIGLDQSPFADGSVTGGQVLRVRGITAGQGDKG